MILKLLAAITALSVVLFSALWFRSSTRDEGMSWKSMSINPDSTRIDREYTLAWGPHGLRFWVWFNKEPIGGQPGDIAAPEVVSWFHWESEHYKQGVSWGWPENNFWNRRGFWFDTKEFRWNDGSSRSLLLAAVPFWILIFAGSVGTGALLRRFKQRTVKPNKPAPEQRRSSVSDESGGISPACLSGER